MLLLQFYCMPFPTDAPDKIPWRPAFCAATELELQDDGMNIDDFAKTLGYALLYKGYGKKVNQVPMEELSASMVRAVYPRDMFAQLRKQGHEIIEKYPGIYYVENNLLFPVQIIVTSELNPELHSSLRILTNHVEIEDVRQFLKEAQTRNTPGERNDIDALLQASVAANFEVYEEIRRNSVMCEALRTLMKDEIEAERQAGQKEGRMEGREASRKDIIRNMLNQGLGDEDVRRYTACEQKIIDQVRAEMACVK
jgi:hypothetical protein